MSEPSLVSQGLELMIFGMGVVFVFLTMLVFVTGFMSKLVTKLTPEPVIVPAKVVTKKQPGVDPQLLKVLSAAVKEHRARQK
ncbi:MULTISPECIES: OadG family protein [Thalassolituus]|jgi:oxaloacetate decarboxylase gamma subunit|nr:OadG family transporter subunit [Thalassolituus oleivorans]PCI50633.1 MAG: oxaloacetate decarboxylase [Oceanospirillales bacterium]PHQ87642.1 MAG: oxaloacetate decarboxylase [Thalassobium sp.]APR66324.1 oxaloacetate decarboxylase [Thalassolituus oleivorans]MBQ0728950.1 OadG family protein [Thalassolituus oleivorans]MBQ0781892.1 OadG family protein [Thalassolituus oleivorans]